MCVPDVLGVLAVWQLQQKKKEKKKAWSMRARRAGVGGTSYKCQKPSEQEVCSHLCHSTCCVLCVGSPNLQQRLCVHQSLCVLSSSCPPIWGRVFSHCVCCGSEQAVHVMPVKWPQGQLSYILVPFVVVAATLFAYTRHCQSPTNVRWLLSLVWCEMRHLCCERVM